MVDIQARLREPFNETVTVNGVSLNTMREKLIEREQSTRDTKLNRIQELCTEHLEYGNETPAQVIHVCQLGTQQVLENYYEKVHALNSASPGSIYHYFISVFPDFVIPDWFSEGF
tara:strand:+ start:615 stop:959 length:345 start_codon:yes stop_codon:yes gene_type:complete